MVDYDEEDEEEDEDSSTPKIYNVFGAVSVFSFISIIMIFIAALITITSNNYAVKELHNISSEMNLSGQIPISVYNVIDSTAGQLPIALQYFDNFWLAAYISFIASTLLYAYFSKRESYFSIMALLIMGILILLFIGGIFIQLTNWFRDEIMVVFPTVLTAMPKFTFYLNNVGIINAVHLILVILVNFIDLDLNKYLRRKDKDDSLGDIE